MLPISIVHTRTEQQQFARRRHGSRNTCVSANNYSSSIENIEHLLKWQKKMRSRARGTTQPHAIYTCYVNIAAAYDDVKTFRITRRWKKWKISPISFWVPGMGGTLKTKDRVNIILENMVAFSIRPEKSPFWFISHSDLGTDCTSFSLFVLVLVGHESPPMDTAFQGFSNIRPHWLAPHII